jgi:predicted ArsR family transcriptional regulator
MAGRKNRHCIFVVFAHSSITAACFHRQQIIALQAITISIQRTFSYC